MKQNNAARAAKNSGLAEKTLFVTLLLLALALFIYRPQNTQPFVMAQTEFDGVRSEEILSPFNSDKNIIFASADIIGIATVTSDATKDGQSSSGETQVLAGIFPSADEVRDSKFSAGGEELGRDGLTKVHGMFPSPVDTLAIVEYDFISRPHVQVFDYTDRTQPRLRDLVPNGWGYFLDWHPSGKTVLIATADMDVSDPGMWLVNVDDGTHQKIETPGLKSSQGIASADFSPDGNTILYSISNGMGLGSEIWSVETSGANNRQVFIDEYSTVGNVVWSPDSSQIAFVKLLDSPVAFAEAGLWVMGADGTEPRPLALMDGGQGQKPVWSSDSNRLYYIARDNPDNLEANYDAELTTTSVRSIGLTDKEPQILVPSEGARQLDLSLSNTGDLMFVSSRTGALEVWALSNEGVLAMLTNDGTNKRYPVGLSSSR